MTENPTVDRTMVRAAALVIVLNLGVTWVNSVRKPAVYPSGFAAVGCALLSAAALFCLIDARRLRPTFTAVRCAAALSLTLMLLHVAMLGVVAPGEYPPLLHTCGAIILAAVVGFGSPVSIVLVVSYGIGYCLVRVQALPLVNALAETLVLLVSGAATVSLTFMARRTVRIVVQNGRLLEQQVAAVARTEARLRERARWDGLVHDKILGALRLAATGDGPHHARKLASEALEAFQTEPTGQLAIESRIRELAGVLGLRFDDFALQQSDAPTDVVQALADSAAEVVTNVARHSGVDVISLRGIVSRHGALVVIADRGAGLDPDGPGEGTGLRTVRARMEAVGGHVQVDSSAAGCSVTLSWARSETPPVLLTWDRTIFVPMIGLGLLDIVLNIVLGITRPAQTHHAWIQALVVVLCLSISVATVTLPPVPFWGWLVVALASAAPVVPILNSAVYGAPDWRYWVVGALTPGVGALAFRFGLRYGLASATLMLLAVLATELALGLFTWASVPGPFPVCFGVAVVAGMLRAALDKATRRLTRDQRARNENARTEAELDARDAEVWRRRAALAQGILPMIESIAHSARVTAAMRAQCALLEASARDQLDAPLLVSSAVSARVQAARKRGVDVVLRWSDGASADRELSGFQQLIGHVCDHLPSGSRARFTWHDQSDPIVGSAALVGGSDLEPVVSTLVGWDLRLIDLGDTALVEIPRHPADGAAPALGPEEPQRRH